MQSNRSLVDICLITVAYHSHTFHTSITWPLQGSLRSAQREFDFKKVINRTHVKGTFCGSPDWTVFILVRERGWKQA